MPMHQDRHRRSLRLKGYDYSLAGAYFVTLNVHQRRHLFGAVGVSGSGEAEVLLNEAGLAARTCWLQIPAHFPLVELDSFIVMPDHVHGIVLLADQGLPSRANRANDYSPLPKGTSGGLGSVVRGFKIGVTQWFKDHRPELPTVWQRNYYEHVIRSDEELNDTRNYIMENPARRLASMFGGRTNRR